MAEHIFYATLRLFEMDGGGTDRRMAPTGNTVDSWRPMGVGYSDPDDPDPDQDCRSAVQITSYGQRALCPETLVWSQYCRRY